MISLLLILLWTIAGQSQENSHETELIGVYQGTSLFIQNPYLVDQKKFCVNEIMVNNVKLNINYRVSALKIDFESNDLFTPVTIKIFSIDSLCNPIVINPDAIFFHSSYKFTALSLNDSVLAWTSEGERDIGVYYIEKLNNGYWDEVETIEAQGHFERANYSYQPLFDEGANMYRIRYDFGNGRHLYSQEVDYDFYPAPVTFSPKSTRSIITFSRVTSFEIYDPNSKLIMSGEGHQVNVKGLMPGDYVIYFDGRDPGVFTKLD